MLEISPFERERLTLSAKIKIADQPARHVFRMCVKQIFHDMAQLCYVTDYLGTNKGMQFFCS